MSARRRSSIAALGLAFALGAIALPPHPVRGATPQIPDIDTALLSNFAWRPIGPLPADGTAMERVSADAAFPYRICGPHPHGVLCGPSRTDTGVIATSDWHLLPLQGTHFVVPDPADADILYTSDLRRYDRRTGQSTDVSPPVGPGEANAGVPAVLAFTADGRTLYAGYTSLWRSANGGQAWTRVGPELPDVALDAASTQGAVSPAKRLTAIAISPIDARGIWIGTDTGELAVTHDAGLTWSQAAPPLGAAPARIAAIESSRFDRSSAYVVVAPQEGAADAVLLRTRDNGLTWTPLSPKLPQAGAVHIVREDSFRRGLLLAGTDRSVFVSFDDGERWQPLALNLPPMAVRDLTVRDSDVVVATGEGGFWILDDISPLRQVTPDIARAQAFVFRPAPAWRVRARAVTPQPAGPVLAAPEGALLTYSLASEVRDPAVLEIIETATGEVIRRFAGNQPENDDTGGPGMPTLVTTAGVHRLFWDLRYTPPEADPRAPKAARVLPGSYQIRLSVGGRPIRQAILVRMDPRIRTSLPDLTAQRTLARTLDAKRTDVSQALEDAAGPPVNETATVPGRNNAARAAALAGALIDLRRASEAVQGADARPSAATERAAAAALARADAALAGFPEL